MRRHLLVATLLATLALPVPQLFAQRLSDLPTFSSYQPPTFASTAADSTRKKVGDYRWESALFWGALVGVAMAAGDFGESCAVSAPVAPGSPSTVSSPCGEEPLMKFVSGLVIGGMVGLLIGSRIPKYGAGDEP